MIATLGALAPVALVIALGWGLRRARFPGDAFWAPAERLTYYVLFPALLVNNLAGAPLATLPVAPMALATASAISGRWGNRPSRPGAARLRPARSARTGESARRRRS